jgi:hypothetical protein
MTVEHFNEAAKMGTSWGRTGDKRGSRPPGANQNESQKISRTSCEIRDNAKFADVVNVLRNVQMAGIGFEVPLVFGGGKRTFSPKLGTPRGYMPRCALSVCKLPRPHSDCGGLTSIHSCLHRLRLHNPISLGVWNGYVDIDTHVDCVSAHPMAKHTALPLSAGNQKVAQQSVAGCVYRPVTTDYCLRLRNRSGQ